MNTIPSHLVINAAIHKKFGQQAGLVKSAFLWGSVLPDVPLGLISIAYFLYYRFFTTQNVSGIMNEFFGSLYFNDPVWIAGHNFLHSPTALLIYAILLSRLGERFEPARNGWLSFVFGAMVHSVIDIATHHDDGPVLFWPFDWQTRFYSPVSYWDKAHYGSEFFYIELVLNLLLVGYLLYPWITQKLRKITR